MTVSLRHQDAPVNERVHKDKHMGDGVEDAEVQALAGLWCLKRWRHLAQKHRFPAVVILVDVGEKEMGKAPALQKTKDVSDRSLDSYSEDRLTKVMR